MSTPTASKRSRTPLWLGLAALVLAVAGVAGYLVLRPGPSALGDATITACGLNAAHALQVEVKVTNPTTVQHDYAVTVAFASGNDGTQIATVVVKVADLQPGQSAKPSGTVPVREGTAGVLNATCSVTSVERT